MVEVHPLVHLAELDVADAVVDLGKERASRLGSKRAGCDVAGQVRTRIIGALYERVPGVTVGGDRGEHHSAGCVLDDPRLMHAAGAVSHGVLIRGRRRRDADREIHHAIAMGRNVSAELGARAYRAAQHQARVPRLQHVTGLVPAAGLRTPVGNTAHAERGRVEVGGLAGVPDGEDHRIHPGDRELVGTADLLAGCLGGHWPASFAGVSGDARSITELGIMRNRTTNY